MNNSKKQVVLQLMEKRRAQRLYDASLKAPETEDPAENEAHQLLKKMGVPDSFLFALLTECQKAAAKSGVSLKQVIEDVVKKMFPDKPKSQPAPQEPVTVGSYKQPKKPKNAGSRKR